MGSQLLNENSGTGQAEDSRFPTAAIESSHEFDEHPLRATDIEIGDAERNASRFGRTFAGAVLSQYIPVRHELSFVRIFVETIRAKRHVERVHFFVPSESSERGSLV